MVFFLNTPLRQAPLGAYTRSFGSLTMRLFAAVYLAGGDAHLFHQFRLEVSVMLNGH